MWAGRNALVLLQVKRVLNSDDDDDDAKDELDKCTICLSEFEEEEDVRYRNQNPNPRSRRPCHAPP